MNNLTSIIPRTSEKTKSNSKKEYRDYLNSREWKDKRETTFELQGRKCRVCGSTSLLQIHHRRYRYNGESIVGKELNAGLLVICQDCHSLWHKLNGYKRIPFSRLRTILQLGTSKYLAFQHPYISIKKLRKNRLGNCESAAGAVYK